MYSSYHKSPLRLWWRRQIFHFRRLSPIWLLGISICILFIILIVLKPFSSQYRRTAINQNVQWDNINEILQIKEQVNRQEILIFENFFSFI
jgi:hypothetical protein